MLRGGGTNCSCEYHKWLCAGSHDGPPITEFAFGWRDRHGYHVFVCRAIVCFGTCHCSFRTAHGWLALANTDGFHYSSRETPEQTEARLVSGLRQLDG